MSPIGFSMFGGGSKSKTERGEEKKDGKSEIREWQRRLRTEGRLLDRNIRRLEAEQRKVEGEVRQAASRPEGEHAARILARELVHSRRARDKLLQSQGQLSSLNMSLAHSLATLSLSGALQKSTEVMSAMNQLLKVPEMKQSVKEMGREMQKSGLIEELMLEAMDVLDDEGIDEEVDEEVDNVIKDILKDVSTKLPSIGTSRIEVPSTSPPVSQKLPTQPEGERKRVAGQQGRV